MTDEPSSAAETASVDTEFVDSVIYFTFQSASSTL